MAPTQPEPTYETYAAVPKDKLVDWYFSVMYMRALAKYKIDEWDSLGLDNTYAYRQLELLDELGMFLSMTKDKFLFGPSYSAPTSQEVTS